MAQPRFDTRLKIRLPRAIHQEAVDEVDHRRLCRRIRSMEWAIAQRLEELSLADGENFREDEALKEARQKIEDRKRYCGSPTKVDRRLVFRRVDPA